MNSRVTTPRSPSRPNRGPNRPFTRSGQNLTHDADRRMATLSRPPASAPPVPRQNAATPFDAQRFDAPDNVLDLQVVRRERREQQEQFAWEMAREKERRKREESRVLREARAERALRADVERRRREDVRLAQCPACHWGLLVLTALLAVLSIPIVYSSSTAIALDHYGNPDFFFWRQVGFAGVGLAAFLLASRLPAQSMRTVVWVLYAVALLGLLAIDFTPLGTDLGSGTRRWLKLGPLPPQQFSELAKIALIGVMADFWSRAAPFAQKSMWPWIVTAILGLPVVALVFLQPHLSAACLLFLLPFFVAFYADAPIRHIGKIMLPLAMLAVFCVMLCKAHRMPGLKDYQQDRIAAHFSSEGADERGSNYQALQSQRALARGGLFGAGLGQSLFKHLHLPAPHTDFILAVIGEELGLVGVLGLLLIYGAMIFFCFHIGHCAESAFEALMCAGVGTLLAIQVICNAGVVTGLMPVTGMPLPLLSYGGSGLFCTLLGVGMVLGVSRRLGDAAGAGEETAADDEASGFAAQDTPQRRQPATPRRDGDWDGRAYSPRADRSRSGALA
jgi:cell division protein FtsW